MVATNLKSYLEKKDKNGVRIGDWAVQGNPSKAICTVCVPRRTIDFKKGCAELFKHSESVVHVHNIDGTITSKKSQPTIEEFTNGKEKDALKSKAKDLEIALVTFLSRHGVSPNQAECLIKILKKYAPDSDIIKNASLGREKARYLTIYGVGEAYEEEIVKKVKNCDAFSVQIDESEVNKVSQLEIVAKIATCGEGIETRHYKCVDLEAGDAETITDTLIDTFEEDGIDYKAKLIDVGMDGCSTMQGHKSGVITRLVDRVPQLVPTGSCNSHNCSNTMQLSTQSFDPDMKSALVDIHQDLGGAKGHGLKKKKEFEAVCRSIGLCPEPIKRFVSTRFRTLRYCIKPVLHNYLGIVKYYKSVKKPTPRQKRLIGYFVDRCDLTRIRLKFIFAATEDLSRAIDFFEQKDAHVHTASDKMERILCTQYRKVLDESELSTLDEETNELSKKTKTELVNLDIDEAKKLSDNELFIGREVEKEIKALGLSPKSPQLTWLFDSARKFHITACEYLKKYFKLGLSSIVLDNMAALSPSRQSHILTGDKLVSLAVKYSKIVDNIQSVDGMDRIKDEIKRYVTDDDVKELEKETFEDFWEEVGKITDGAAGWLRFEILPRFALALGTKHDATGDVERGFSTMNLIHQNKQRNSMEQETLNAHLLIKAGVEAKEVTKICDKCKVCPIVPHCHCELFDVSELMRQKCKVAWQKCLNAQANAALVRNEVSEEMEERKKKCEEEETNRIEQVMETLKVKKVFCSFKYFEPVYKPTEKSKVNNSKNVRKDNLNDKEKSKEMVVKPRTAKPPTGKPLATKPPAVKPPAVKPPSFKIPKTPSSQPSSSRKLEDKDYNANQKSGIKRKASSNFFIN